MVDLIDTIVYAGRLKDKSALMSSSSGGAFTALSDFFLKNGKDGKITYLTFKDKRNGWKSPTAYVKVNGAEKPIKDYVKVFYNRCALRPSCYECPYATTERKTDMTIGDFWHIEETIPDFYDPNGNSLFLIHTNRGEESVKADLDAQNSVLFSGTSCQVAGLKKYLGKEYDNLFCVDIVCHGVHISGKRQILRLG